MFVISGTSGAGKGTIVERVRRTNAEAGRPLWWSVSWTTRAPRDGERDGFDYHFVSEAEFLASRDAGGFLESFQVYGQWKGTPLAPIRDAVESGHDVLLELDINGAEALSRHFPDAVVVFLVPPSGEEQHRRLAGRGTDTEADIERRRLEAEREERRARDLGFHVVVNDDLETAVAEVTAILAAARRPA